MFFIGVFHRLGINMQLLFVLLAVAVIFLAGLAWFTKAYAAYLYKKMYADPLSVVNEIIENETVPDKWRIAWLEWIARKNGETGIIASALKQHYLRKLGQCISGLKRLTVPDIRAKDSHLEALEQIRQEWLEARSWEQM